MSVTVRDEVSAQVTALVPGDGLTESTRNMASHTSWQMLLLLLLLLLQLELLLSLLLLFLLLLVLVLVQLFCCCYCWWSSATTAATAVVVAAVTSVYKYLCCWLQYPLLRVFLSGNIVATITLLDFCRVTIL